MARKIEPVPETERIRIGCDTDARNDDSAHPNPVYVDAERWGKIQKGNKMVQRMIEDGEIAVYSETAKLRKIENRTTGVLVLE